MTEAEEDLTLRRLWSLREDVGVEADESGVVLVAPWAEIDLGPRGLALERELRRLSLGPVDLHNVELDDLEQLTSLLEDVSGVVVHSLQIAGRSRTRLSAVPVADSAPFRPRPVAAHEIVRLSKLAWIRPWSGNLVVSAPRGQHDVVCEGFVLGGLLSWLATARQLSDLSGRPSSEEWDRPAVLVDLSPPDMEHLIGWLVAAGVVLVRRADGRYADDVDPDLDGWTPHELEFELRTRRPRQAVGERSRLRVSDRPPPALHRAPFPGIGIPLPVGVDREGTVSSVLREDCDGPAFAGLVLTTEALGGLLYRGACVLGRREPSPDAGSSSLEIARRPYLSIDGLYGLEIYVALDRAELPRGLYHYRPDQHALVAIDLPLSPLGAIIAACSSHVGVQQATPAAVMLTTVRRARVEWALGSVTHATGLAEAGALSQVLHLVGWEVDVDVHPLALDAAEGWSALTETLWPAEAPVGVHVIDARPPRAEA